MTAIETAPQRRDPLVPAMAGLVVVDVAGGLLAVGSGVDTWGGHALLAAPVP